MSLVTVVPLADFAGEPLDSELQFAVDESFAEAVQKLAPEWTWTRDGLLTVLRAFDERGLLRPVLRARLPQTFALYDYQRPFASDADDRPDWAEFNHLRFALTIRRRQFEDPADLHPVQRDLVLAPYLERGEREQRVDWSAWTERVGERRLPNGVVLPFTRTWVKSLYATWQRLRAWSLLHAYTVRVLLDPRTGQDPWDLSLDAARLGENALSWQVGLNRPDSILQQLGADGWLTALYRTRGLVEWAEMRTYEPELMRWPEGVTMSLDARWRMERDRLATRCRRLADAWLSVAADSSKWPGASTATDGVLPERFRERVRGMLEVWRWAQQHDHAKFAEALSEDLAAASTWAIFAYDTTLTRVDSEVGQLHDNEETTLLSVLRPTRTRASRRVKNLLPYIVDQYNNHIAQPKLSESDASVYLELLDQNELWAWTMELADWFDVEKGPGDVVRDRHFLHLRSLALLTEPILSLLADSYGTPSDKACVGTGTVEGPLKVFLADRADWRRDLWEAVKGHRHLTRTNESAIHKAPPPPWTQGTSANERFSACVDAIQALTLKLELEGAAKQILTLWTMRNFGAHKFTRDAGLMNKYSGVIAGAVLFAPLFYWKIATTMR